MIKNDELTKLLDRVPQAGIIYLDWMP